MMLLIEVIMQKLKNAGILEIGGKPLEDCSPTEIRDEWDRLLLMRSGK